MSRGVHPIELGVLLLTSALAQLILSHYFPTGLYIDLPLILTVYVGWYSSPAKGALGGTLFGLSQDVIQLLPVWGLNGSVKTLSGFLAAYLNRWILAESLPTRGLIIGAIAAIDHLTVCLMIILFSADNPRIFPAVIWKALWTGLAGTLFFHFYNRFKFPARDYSQM